MQNDLNVSFPVSNKSTIASIPGSNLGSTRKSEFGTSFAATLKGVTAEISNTQTVRSAKATELYDWLIEGGALDPEWADTAAFLYGCEYIDSPMIYIGDWPIIRIAATGEIFTPEKEAYFKKISDLYYGGRVNLYETELAKGTPPLQILAKIFDYNETLPDEFRKMSGWL